MIVSDIENEDFEKFLEYKEQQGKSPSAKRVRKKTEKEIETYHKLENERKKTVAKRSREA